MSARRGTLVSSLPIPKGDITARGIRYLVIAGFSLLFLVCGLITLALIGASMPFGTLIVATFAAVLPVPLHQRLEHSGHPGSPGGVVHDCTPPRASPPPVRDPAGGQEELERMPGGPPAARDAVLRKHPRGRDPVLLEDPGHPVARFPVQGRDGILGTEGDPAWSSSAPPRGA